MKVIQTRYKGFLFRSRLEARWAVFFDALQVKWHYEHEGFEFDDGTRYLPDFWLPELNLWVEVKGKPIQDNQFTLTSTDPVVSKIVQLRKATGAACMLVRDPTETCHWIGYDHKGETQFHRAKFVCLDRVGIVSVRSPGNFSNGAAFTSKVVSQGPLFTPGFNFALQAFRSARFEFGETPVC